MCTYGRLPQSVRKRQSHIISWLFCAHARLSNHFECTEHSLLELLLQQQPNMKEHTNTYIHTFTHSCAPYKLTYLLAAFSHNKQVAALSVWMNEWNLWLDGWLTGWWRCLMSTNQPTLGALLMGSGLWREGARAVSKMLHLTLRATVARQSTQKLMKNVECVGRA